MATGAKALNAVEFLRICGRLKRLKRTGWVNNRVELPESVADHMYRMSMCCMLLDSDSSSAAVDRSKCIKMAIVHDLAESLVGDITPHDGVAEEDKHRMEKVRALERNCVWLPMLTVYFVQDALEHICGVLGESQAATEIRELWHEYEAGTTEEAKIVKDFDKFEMILQADEYEQEQGKALDDFFRSTQGKFRTPLVQSWVAELTAQRATRKALEPKHEAAEQS